MVAWPTTLHGNERRRTAGKHAATFTDGKCCCHTLRWHVPRVGWERCRHACFLSIIFIGGLFCQFIEQGGPLCQKRTRSTAALQDHFTCLYGSAIPISLSPHFHEVHSHPAIVKSSFELSVFVNLSDEDT
jgi:hypothetical protein